MAYPEHKAYIYYMFYAQDRVKKQEGRIMENASDALKMAFSVFVFIIALSMVFSLISKVKETADAILFNSDRTTYYDWIEGDLENGRTVDADTVISALNDDSNDLTYIFVESKDGSNIYPSTNSEQEIIDEIKNKQYKERIVEVTTGGKYLIADDGTQISVGEGQLKTKIYLFYTEI